MELHRSLTAYFLGLSDQARTALAAEMGLDLRPGYAAFEVRSLQFARKASPDRDGIPQALISVVQERTESLDDGGAFAFRGGCTVVVDLCSGQVEYLVSKNVRNPGRLAEERSFRLASRADLAGLYLGALDEADSSRQFAHLHGLNPELVHG